MYLTYVDLGKTEGINIVELWVVQLPNYFLVNFFELSIAILLQVILFVSAEQQILIGHQEEISIKWVNSHKRRVLLWKIEKF